MAIARAAIVCAVVAIAALSPARARHLAFDPGATFSILGYNPDTGEFGGAVQSRVFSVGNGVLRSAAMIIVMKGGDVWINNDVVLRISR